MSSAGDSRDGVVLRVAADSVLNHQTRVSRDELRLAIITWIERTYHRRRRQRGLGRLPPVEVEALIGNTDRAQAA